MKFKLDVLSQFVIEADSPEEAKKLLQERLVSSRDPGLETRSKIINTTKQLEAGELFDAEAFNRDIESARREDDELYKQYLEAMNSSYDPIIPREEYQNKESEVLKGYYRDVLFRLNPKEVLLEVASQPDDLDDQLGNFPARKIAREILERNGQPTDKQLQAIVNVYTNYLVDRNEAPAAFQPTKRKKEGE